MKLKELIKNENFDYIEFRHRLSEELRNVQIYMGACKSIDGKLISLEGANYSEEMEIIEYKRWVDNIAKNGWSNNIAKNGLTVIY